MSERPDMEGPWTGGSEWSDYHLATPCPNRWDHLVPPKKEQPMSKWASQPEPEPVPVPEPETPMGSPKEKHRLYPGMLTFIYVLYVGALALLLGVVWWAARILPEVP